MSIILQGLGEGVGLVSQGYGYFEEIIPPILPLAVPPIPGAPSLRLEPFTLTIPIHGEVLVEALVTLNVSGSTLDRVSESIKVIGSLKELSKVEVKIIGKQRLLEVLETLDLI